MLGLLDGDPRTLGPYRIAGRLGQGGMGTVYLAEGAAGPVALKVISPQWAADAEFVARFRREVAAARRVRRFCTAPVLDAQLDVEPFWLVTEYVAGPDLHRVLRERGPLTGSNLEALAVGVATALAAIHGAGIVHRDLKPANVLLSPLGPRVIDFGIARALDTDGDGDRTATGQWVGTPDYMAPELTGGGTWSTASDVFAWGCVVFAAAMGHSPFAANTAAAAFYRVRHDEPELDRLDSSVRGAVAAALHKDPKARPSAQELLARLVGSAQADSERLAGSLRLDLSGFSGGARSGRPRPSRRRKRRSRLLITASAAVLLAVTATGATMLWSRSGAPPAFATTLFSDEYDYQQWPTTTAAYRTRGRYDVSARPGTSETADAPVNAVMPDRFLMTARFSLDGTLPGSAGVHCSFTSHADRARPHPWYRMNVTSNGYAHIRKSSINDEHQLTADIPIPGFDPADIRVVGECSWEGDRVGLAMWVNGREIGRVADERPEARDKVTLGVFANNPPEGDDAMKASFDTFEVG